MPEAPKSGLGILVDEKRVNELITQRTGAKAIIKAGIMLMLFISFLLLFTMLGLSEPRSDFYAFEGFVRRRFDLMASMPLHEVESASKFWQYINRSFVPALYGNDTEHYFYPDHSPSVFLPIGVDGQAGLVKTSANVLLGVGRLRMLKVLPNMECKVASYLEEAFPTCFGPFSASYEDRESFGPPNMLTGDNVFPYYSLDGQATEGKVSIYPAGGFMAPFTSNYNVTTTMIQTMVDNDFVGPATRAIILDFTIYNFNLGYYAVCRMLFEVTPSGNWVNTFDVDILMPRHIDAISAIFLGDWFPLVGQVMLMLFVLGYVLEEMSEFVGFRGGRPYIKMDYFGDPWNLLDWLQLFLCFLTFLQMMSTWSASGALKVYTGDPSTAGLQTFTDYSATAAGVRGSTRMIAFNMVVTWFKAVKYISILPYINTFMETVTMTQRMIGSFVCIFSSALFGFVLAYSVAFGEQISELRTPWGSFVFLMRSFVGNANMTAVLDTSPFLASVLTFMFVLSMIFVILNVFFAIMISALADAKASQDNQGKGWQVVMSRANDLWLSACKDLRLEHRFRTCVPGLYSRINQYRKRVAEKEEERDLEVLRKERMRKPDASLGLGPGDPSIGRRPARVPANLNVDDLSDSDQGSEVDLGPLHRKDQLTGKRFDDPGLGGPEPEKNLMDSTDDSANGFFGSGNYPGQEDEITEDGIKLVIKATRHIVGGIVDRTHGARGVLFSEMTESKEVLLKVGSVLEILARRARDLEAQQEQLLCLF